MLVYRRERPIVWTKADAISTRAFFESVTGVKLLAFHEDEIINAILARKDLTFLDGWRFSLTEMKRFCGSKDSVKPEALGEPVPIQFSDDIPPG